MHAHPQLRPLSFGEVLDVSIKLCVRHWRVLVPIAVALSLPLALASSFVQLSTQDAQDAINAANRVGEPPSGDDLAVTFGGLAFVAVIALVLTLLLTGALFRGIGDAYLGEKPEIGRSVSFGLARAPSILWVLLLTIAGTVLLALLLILPGIWFGIAATVAVPVLLTERVKGVAAVRRSLALVKGRWWTVFGLVIVSNLLAGVIAAVLGGIAAAVASADSDAATFLVSTITDTIAYGITAPFTAAVTAVIYFDLRVRKEGFDLELLARALDGEAGLDAAGPLGGAPAGPRPAPPAPVTPPSAPAAPFGSPPAAPPAAPPPGSSGSVSSPFPPAAPATGIPEAPLPPELPEPPSAPPSADR